MHAMPGIVRRCVTAVLGGALCAAVRAHAAGGQAGTPPGGQPAPARPATTGPAVIVGRVLDRAERPLPGATVVFEDAEFETRAGADGSFALSIDFVPDGVVSVRLVGYVPARSAVHLTRGDTVRLVARRARLGVLARLGLPLPVDEGPGPALVATLETPRGRVTLR